MLQDFRYVCRSLWHDRGFAVVSVVCLAIGLGANTSLFGVVDSLLFRPPAVVVDPESVVRLRLGASEQPGRPNPFASSFTYPQYLTLREQSSSLAGIAAYSSRSVTMDGGVEARNSTVIVATSNYFSLLGVSPLLGRFFMPEEDAIPGSGPVVVVSYDFWNGHLGGDQTALGQLIRLNGVMMTVIGVAPKAFVGVDLGSPDFWIPMGMAPTEEFGGPRQWTGAVRWLQLIGRLRPGLHRNSAQALLASSSGISDPFATAPDRPPPVRLLPLTTNFGPLQNGENPVPLWVLGISAAVLLLSCTTVANLVLNRAMRRGKEVAIRLSLGATHGRMIKLLLMESVVLSAFALLLGLVLAAWSVRLVQLLPIPPTHHLIGVRSIAFALVLSLVVTFAFGLAPALWVKRANLHMVIKEGAARSSSGRSPLQSGLLIGQISISFVLLVCAGLFLRSLHNVKAIDPGFDPDRVLVANVDLRSRDYGSASAAEFYGRGLERIRSLPFVSAASIGQAVPFSMMVTSSVRIPDGRPEEEQPSSMFANVVDTDFFRTLGIQLKQGRLFTEDDRESSFPVAVVSESMARSVWPDGSALSQCFRAGYQDDSPCLRVVGIVEDTKIENLTGEARPSFYRATLQSDSLSTSMTFFVRLDGDPAEHGEAIRRQIQGLDVDLPFVNTHTLADLVKPQLIAWQVAAILFSMFGGMALLLAAVGLYVVIAVSVSQRTRELGVRAALGASSQRLLSLVLADGARMAMMGIGLGAVLSLGVTRIFASKMYGVVTADWVTYLGVCIVLALTALVGSYLPARRVAKIQPTEALRHD